jgi:hypothetical protein
VECRGILSCNIVKLMLDRVLTASAVHDEWNGDGVCSFLLGLSKASELRFSSSKEGFK